MLYADRHLTATLDPGVLAEARDANLRDRLLSLERSDEHLAVPSDSEFERSQAAVEELNPDSDEYLEAFAQHGSLTDRKLADSFLSSVLPTLSPGYSGSGPNSQKPSDPFSLSAAAMIPGTTGANTNLLAGWNTWRKT